MWVGGLAGGSSGRPELICIFDVGFWYRVFSCQGGWMGWASARVVAGRMGYNPSCVRYDMGNCSVHDLAMFWQCFGYVLVILRV